MFRLNTRPLRTRIRGPLLLSTVLILSALPALLPFLTEGLTRSFDGGLHLLRLGALDRHLRAGVLYPRWTPELLLGLGYPLFSYYAPASYYLAEIFVLLGAPPYWALIAAFSLLVVAAGAGMFMLARDTFGRNKWLAALASAVAYMYAPYLLTNIYIRGALAEAAAQTLLPWILWSARRLCRSGQPGLYYLSLALSLALLAVTHNITLLFLPLLLLGWLVLHWWLGGRSRAALFWAAAALLTAAAASAFFWLPLIIERVYLAGTPYQIARSVWLPASAWTWANFLDAGLHYTHTFARPIRLGLVQAVLGLLGFLLARRRDPEWFFWAAIALVSALAMTTWALPIWLNFEVLAVAQFTWRLLSILSLPLALFVGGILLRVPAGLAYALVTTALYSTIVFAHAPQLAWMDVFAPETTSVSASVFAQIEREKGVLSGGEGNSSIQEFRPRWADQTLVLDSMTAAPEAPVSLELRSASDYGLHANVSAVITSTLRFTSFYFPGWQATLDRAPLLTTPSTNLGLLTAQIPPGEHDLAITWTDTPLQRIAALFSLLALAIAAFVGWSQHTRTLAAAAVVVVLLGLTGWTWRQVPQPISSPPSALQLPGARLLGYRIQWQDPSVLEIFPYWYVTQTPSDLVYEWQLRDASGATLASTIARPYYNTHPATGWPPATLVDDAQRLDLPAGLAVGDYALWLGVTPSPGSGNTEPTLLGRVRLDKPIPDPGLTVTPASVRYGDNLLLDGFDILAPPSAHMPQSGIPAVAPGDHLRMRLHWRAAGLVDRNDHAFVHLVDHRGSPLVQEDQLPGPLFQPPMLWNPGSASGDVYLLRIPHDTPNGLFWPSVGMYDFADQDRLPIYPAGAAEPVDDFRLPPLKVLSRATAPPDHELDVQIGDFAVLTGFDVSSSDATLLAGGTFSITLHFTSRVAISRDLIRFVQLYDPAIGVVAQFDGSTQDGANPTWAWLPGEKIRDEVRLSLAADTPPGIYTLYAGLYDPQAGDARVPLTGADGTLLADAWAPLTTITVQDTAR